MTTERILTEYTADTRGFRRGAREYDRTLARQERLVNQRLGRIDQRWERSTRSILNQRTALVGLGSVVSGTALSQLRSYAEGWRDVERRLTSIGETSEASQRKLVDVALRTRSAISGTAAAIQRLSKSTGDDLDTTSRRVETLQKLLASAGSSGTERASVSLQLGQALQSGVLSGDEFRSIRENAPVEFLDALAQSAGITRQELKEFAEDQLLTTDIVLDALDNLASTADQKFGSLSVSGEEAFNVLTTGLTVYAGNVDEALGATDAINGVLVTLGRLLSDAGAGAETFAQILAVAGTVALTVAGNRGVGAVTAAFVASAQARRTAVAVAKEEATQSRANLAQYRAEKDAADARVRAAQADIRTRAQQGRVTKASRLELERAQRGQVRAATALTGAQTSALATTRALTAAQGQLSIKTRLATLRTRALTNAMAFFGGPIGLAITAIAGGLAIMSARTAAAERATSALKGRVDSLAAAYATAGGNLDKMRASIAGISIAQATKEARDLQQALARAQQSAQGELSKPFLQNLQRLRPEVFDVVRAFAEGETSAKEFRDAMNELATAGGGELANLVLIAEDVVKDLLAAADASQLADDQLALLTATGEELRKIIQRLTGDAEAFGDTDMSGGISEAADEANRLAFNLANALKLSNDVSTRVIRKGVASGALPPQAIGDAAQTDAEKAITDRALASIVNGRNQRSRSGGRSGGAGRLAREERDLAAARALLAENGQRALFIEESMNAERERLRELLPALRELGLSQADAQRVINSELVRYEKTLKDVGQTGTETFETIAEDMFSIVQSADNLSDAIGGIKDRLLQLANDRAFDLLREQFASLEINSGQSGRGLGAFVKKFFGLEAATGGLIRGPGTATSDSIPARLSDGEFVVRARSVTPRTLPLLHAINSGVTVPRFAQGGLVSTMPPPAISGSPLLNVEIHNHATSARVEAQPTPDGQGLKVLVIDAVAEGLLSGRLDRPMNSVFGLRRQARGT
ncbi:tape measure protein [uncultured Tateyamaria sp.]|uniref:tape measure protein n=1 Tax=Tateyamaria sp. 1078 TaxID=3417464 RepID=UPI00260EEA2E|nr:tape measure protein [uncultured Tateyamaria sp.]